MKSIFTPILAATLLFSQPAQGGEISDWAKPGYNAVNSAGMIPFSIATNKISDNITREEFCELIMNMYDAIGGRRTALNADSPFLDTQNAAVARAYSLGIINGRSETEFCPRQLMTRQEMAKTIMRALDVAGIETELSFQDAEKLFAFDDFGDTDSWATDYVAKTVKYDIINGITENTIVPKGFATREQALTMISRTASTFDVDTLTYNAPEFKNIKTGETFSKDVDVSWSRVSGATEYTLIVKDEAYVCVQTDTGDDTKGKIVVSPLVPGTKYTVTVAAKIRDGAFIYSNPIEIEYEKQEIIWDADTPLSQRYNRVFPGGVPFATYEDAANNMQLVTIPVWKLASDGSKYSSKMELMVNKNLASEVVDIFREIYNDPEQFPIKDAGGFSWRNTAGGNVSQHSYGTCIDINANENYYCYASTGEAIVGSHWKPGEDPYSIPSNGSVVKAFAKRGWKWGGNAWTTLRDYMHFTYLGN